MILSVLKTPINSRLFDKIKQNLTKSNKPTETDYILFFIRMKTSSNKKLNPKSLILGRTPKGSENVKPMNISNSKGKVFRKRSRYDRNH